jgi:hypothetical protein
VGIAARWSRSMVIKVRYTTIDRYKETKSFSTLRGARAYAQKWVGRNPDMGSHYAISDDGVGKITMEWISFEPIGTETRVNLRDLFGDEPLNMASAKALVAPLGFTLTKREAEYRLAPIAGTPAEREAQAYYSSDLEDVIRTAQCAVAHAHFPADDGEVF